MDAFNNNNNKRQCRECRRRLLRFEVIITRQLSTLIPCNFQNIILEGLQIFLQRIHRLTDRLAYRSCKSCLYYGIVCMHMLLDSYLVLWLSLWYSILFMFHRQLVIRAYSFLVVRISLIMTCNNFLPRMTLLSMCDADKTYEWSCGLSFLYLGG